MYRIASLIAIFSIAVLLTGCVKVSMEETVLPNLKIKRHSVIDFSPSREIMDALGELQPEEKQNTEPIVTEETCDQVLTSSREEEDIRWHSLQCTVIDDHTLGMDGMIDVKRSKGITLSRTRTDDGMRYRYAQKTDRDQMLSSNDDSVALEDLFLYTITMPGEIVSASAGIVNGSTVTIDSDTPELGKFMAQKEFVVESVVWKQGISRNALQKANAALKDGTCGTRKSCSPYKPRTRKQYKSR